MDDSYKTTKETGAGTDRPSPPVRCEAVEETLAVVFNSVADAIFIHDAAGNLVHVNDKALAMFGVGTEEVMRLRTAGGYYGARVDPQLLEEIWREVLYGSVRTFEWQTRRASDESIFEVEIFLRTLRLQEQDLILATVRDITAGKLLERELADALAETRHLRGQTEADKLAKTEFLTNMSHELRTPLNAVIGLSEILEDQTFGSLNDRQSEYTREIASAGRILLQLINDILDLAKAEAGKTVLNRAPFRLGPLLAYSLFTIREEAVCRGLTLSLDLEEGLDDAVILGDEAKLKQIVSNLLSNAAKFTADRGAITLAARTGGDNFVISVTDTGIGLNPADRERIFEAFRQVDASYARTRTGTGLGLALTRRLVELHGGRIWVESAGVGKGCSFHFTIPVMHHPSQQAGQGKRQGAGLAADSGLPQPERAPRGTRATVLVVGTGHTDLKREAEVLHVAGYGTLEAGSAEEGFIMAAGHLPDAILVEVPSSGIDGSGLIKRLKEDVRTCLTPVIAITAPAMKDVRERAFHAGCDAFWTRPLDIRTVSETLTRLVTPKSRS